MLKFPLKDQLKRGKKKKLEKKKGKSARAHESLLVTSKIRGEKGAAISRSIELRG